MKVHDLFVALSQCDRGASVTIKDGKIAVGGKVLKVKGQKSGDDDEKAEETKPEQPEGGTQ